MRPLSVRAVLLAVALALTAWPNAWADPPPASAPKPLRDGYPPAFEGLIYKDPATGVILYIETDGRHVAAISPEGRLLWRKDPFIDAGLTPYRVARPTITAVGPATGWAARRHSADAFAALRYSSSQFGVIDLATGVFTFLGQN